MQKALRVGLASAAGAAIGSAIVYYLRERATPAPHYRTLLSDGGFEIREYGPVVVAETVVHGPRKQALRGGFRKLADYIFAKSRDGEALPMTVPVLQDGGDPMASDPPMFDDDLSDGAWRTRFVMPDGRSADDLPDPPEDVALVEIAPRRVGVASFSGTASDAKLNLHEDQLRGWLTRQGESARAEPEYAFYNSPMIPPPLRKNEVLIPIG